MKKIFLILIFSPLLLVIFFFVFSQVQRYIPGNNIKLKEKCEKYEGKWLEKYWECELSSSTSKKDCLMMGGIPMRCSSNFSICKNGPECIGISLCVPACSF